MSQVKLSDDQSSELYSNFHGLVERICILLDASISDERQVTATKSLVEYFVWQFYADLCKTLCK